MIEMEKVGRQARAASKTLALISAKQKNQALEEMASALLRKQAEIIAANQVDVAGARDHGLSEAMVDRLVITPERLVSIVADLRHVAQLEDPVGEKFEQRTLDNGLLLYKQRVPVGVLGVIYESRPNVTVDITGLALKSGNAAILRGGSETIHTNRILVDIIRAQLEDCGLPVDAIQFIDSPDRDLIAQLLRMYEYVDLIIPRGGAGLHKYCRENSLIPVIVGGIGICHLYVDQTADLQNSLDIIHNAKVQRPSVCNALDTVLVDQRVAAEFLPQLVERMAAAGVRLVVTENTIDYLSSPYTSKIEPAGPEDFDREWLSLVMGIKVVSGLEEAMQHIQDHSTFHSDGILTRDPQAMERFVNTIDSAVVYVNASTRFTDGAQFGLGAEVAVSTQKVHARGPMALRELTSYKWVVIGTGQIRK